MRASLPVISGLARNASGPDHETMFVPPIEETTSPTGTFISAFSFRPKYQAMAENVGAFSPVARCQRPSASVAGVARAPGHCMNTRMPGALIAAISSAVAYCLSTLAMLDCPEQNHTSPTRMSCSSTLVFPVAASTSGPPAFCAGSVTAQAPSAPAFVRTLASPSVTVIFSPGAATPVIGSGTPR